MFLSSATLLQTFKDAVTGGYSVGSNKSCITKNFARKKGTLHLQTGPCLAELMVTGENGKFDYGVHRMSNGG